MKTEISAAHQRRSLTLKSKTVSGNSHKFQYDNADFHSKLTGYCPLLKDCVFSVATSVVWVLVFSEMCSLCARVEFQASRQTLKKRVFHRQLLSFPSYLSSAKSALEEERRLPQTQTAGKRSNQEIL